jgi:DNA-binding MarR family transcriptional regulator
LRHFTETFAELGLTQKQVSVLWLVDDHPGIAQTDLAQRLQMDRATTMAIINRLQAKQLLRRDRSAHDGRKQALYLEPEGHAMLARAKLKGGVKYYGAYPGGFLERARILLGVLPQESLLHVCGGRAREYPYRGFGPLDKTLDLDPALEPDYLQNALAPVPGKWRAILADPPYSPWEAGHYTPGEKHYPNPGPLLANIAKSILPGGRIGILHYLWCKAPPGFRTVAKITVAVGTNNRDRCFTVFESEEDLLDFLS